jgi:hypothetical protein
VGSGSGSDATIIYYPLTCGRAHGKFSIKKLAHAKESSDTIDIASCR